MARRRLLACGPRCGCTPLRRSMAQTVAGDPSIRECHSREHVSVRKGASRKSLGDCHAFVHFGRCSRSANFDRAEVAAREGLHAAFAFPIVLRNEVLGVFEFISRDVWQCDEPCPT